MAERLMATLQYLLEKLKTYGVEHKYFWIITTFVVFFTDAVLLTAIVPIAPDILLSLDYKDNLIEDNNNSAFANASTTDVTSYTDADTDAANSELGWLLSSKAAVQLVVNSVMASVTNRFGYRKPLLIGTIVQLLCSLLYAFGSTFVLLSLGRMVHGISSALVSVSSFSLLASRFPDDMERSKAIGTACSASALGVLVGYPYGSVCYEFMGRAALFLVLSGCIILALLPQLVAVTLTDNVVAAVDEKHVDDDKSNSSSVGVLTLLKDAEIIIAAGVMLLPEMAMSMLETSLPLWLLQTLHARDWQLGLVFIPDSIGYFIACHVFGRYTLLIGRRLTASLCLFLIAASLLCVPQVPGMLYLAAPHFILGFALGMSNAAVRPLLADIMDSRYASNYGSIYVISETAVQLGFALGPVCAGTLTRYVSFAWAMRSIAVANVLFCPLCYLIGTNETSGECKRLLGEKWRLLSERLGSKESFRLLKEDCSCSEQNNGL